MFRTVRKQQYLQPVSYRFAEFTVNSCIKDVKLSFISDDKIEEYPTWNTPTGSTAVSGYSIPSLKGDLTLTVSGGGSNPNRKINVP